MTRPTWDEWALGVAAAVARRGDCTRRQVGAVILDLDHRVISVGYNGAPPGAPGCLTDGACPRGRHTLKDCCCGQGSMCVCAPYCVCGNEWPCKYDVPPGSAYSNCDAVHAEANALLYARASVQWCTLYCTDEPCHECWRLIKGAQIGRVVTPHKNVVVGAL